MAFGKKIRWILAFSALAMLAAVTFVFFISRHRGGSSMTVKLLPDAKTMMSLSNVHQTATKNGRIQWELRAAAARLLAEGKAMELDRPRVEFFTADGTRVSLEADTGRLNLETNDITVEGHVSISNSRYKLSTEHAAYQYRKQLIVCGKPVKIVGPGIQLGALTMRYDLKANKTVFEGRIEGVLSEIPAI